MTNFRPIIMKHKIIVSAVIKKKNKILLARKAVGRGPYPDTWHIPGGAVNYNTETCEEAIIREIKEETGIKVKNLEKIYWDTDIEPDKNGIPTYYIFLVFKCDYVSGGAAGDDIENLEWTDIEKLSKYNLNRPNKILFKKMGYL